MVPRRLVISTVAFIIAGTMLLAFAAPTTASPSSGLAAVLAEIRFMLRVDHVNLVKWSKSSLARPENPAFEPQKAEVAILDLGDADRDAILSWLRGNGRAALHAQGASDADIGPTIPSIDTAATPDNPWRIVPLATTSIDPLPQSAIQILGGFAAVRKDGKGAIVCVSFKNVDPRVAKHVVIEFPFIGDGDQALGSLELDRLGEFSPNTAILSYPSLLAWQSGTGPHAQTEGCIGRDLPTAAIPFLQARTVGYHVKQVDYVDPGPAGAPSAAPAATTAPNPR